MRAVCFPNSKFVRDQCSPLSNRGVEVLFIDLSLITLFSSELGKDDVVILNWFEDYYSWHENPVLVFFKSLIFLFLVIIFCRNIIWVVHNFKAHSARYRFLSNILRFLLSHLSVVTVRLRRDRNAHMVRHPFVKFNNSSVVQGDPKIDSPILYDALCFGKLAEYKGIVELINSWPADRTLLILGKAYSEEYLSKIEFALGNKHNIKLIDKKFTDDELIFYMKKVSCVIVPNKLNTMYVSGAAITALSHGCKVIIKDWGCYVGQLKEFPFVFHYDEKSLSLVLKKCLSYDISKNEIIKDVGEFYCAENILKDWSRVFNSIGISLDSNI